jgi:hypothetical protein
MSTIAAAAQTADRIDYRIRRHVIQYGTPPLKAKASSIPVAIDASGSQQSGSA